MFFCLNRKTLINLCIFSTTRVYKVQPEVSLKVDLVPAGTKAKNVKDAVGKK